MGNSCHCIKNDKENEIETVQSNRTLKLSNVIMIQAIVRGFLARRRLKKIKTARRHAGLAGSLHGEGNTAFEGEIDFDNREPYENPLVD